MVDLTSLLEQAPVDHSARAETLTDTLRKHATELRADSPEMTILVEGLRAQRVRWNIVQASGSKERVSSGKISKAQAPVLAGFTVKPRKIVV
jgi:hypothetical protein